MAGQTAFTESGKPLSPSQTRKNTSETPRLRSSVSTAIQNFADFRRRRRTTSPRCPLVAAEVDPDRGIDRPVRDLPVANLHPRLMASRNTAAYTGSSGRLVQVCISSITRSVIREIVSSETWAS